MSRSIVFSGKSGTRYRFEVLPLGTQLKPAIGVYLVTKRTLDDRTFSGKGTHQPVMIGHAVDMSAALFSDHHRKAFAARGAEYICVCRAKDAAECIRIERDLIDAHNEASGFRQFLIEPNPPQAIAGPPFKS